MSKQHYISSFCLIEDQRAFLNGEEVFAGDNDVFAAFAKKMYQQLDPNYPKFYKMDPLSKLAFLASELLFKGNPPAEGDDVALVFSNRSSSLDTDFAYQESISNPENYFPSPAVFVYTLPNICMGEVSIRHRLNSENAFFVTEQFDPELMADYANHLISTGKSAKVLCAWTELFREDYKAFFYLVSTEGTLPHEASTIQHLYIKNKS